MIKVWKFLSVSIVVAVCLGLTMVPAAVLPEVALAQTKTVGMEVVPSVTNVGYDENFSVSINITDTVAQDMAAWTVYLLFNTSLLSVTGIDPVVTLPTGYAADDIPGYPTWDNATGVVDHQSGTGVGDPYVNTSFEVMTVHFRSKDVPGTAHLNFVAINPIKQTSVLNPDALGVLNWAMVVNGTVRVGSPKLTVNVAPALKGNVTINAVTPSSYPNTTDRSWDEVVNLTAVVSVPSWTFINWSGDLSGSANPTNITMDDSKNVTANFAPNCTLTMAVDGNGTTVPAVGSHTYGKGTVVNISADPDPGWQFVNWTTVNMSEIDNSTAKSTTVIVDENKTVTANFAEITAAILEGHVNFPGAPEGPRWVRGLEVMFFNSTTGNETAWSPMNATTNSTGVFNITGLDPGTYDIGIKNWTCLSELNTSVALTVGNITVVDFGTTREGDADNNDYVNILDASSLVGAFGSSQGGPGWNAHCDFNRDGNVNILDASALASNFGQHGDLT